MGPLPKLLFQEMDGWQLGYFAKFVLVVRVLHHIHSHAAQREGVREICRKLSATNCIMSIACSHSIEMQLHGSGETAGSCTQVFQPTCVQEHRDALDQNVSKKSQRNASPYFFAETAICCCACLEVCFILPRTSDLLGAGADILQFDASPGTSRHGYKIS